MSYTSYIKPTKIIFHKWTPLTEIMAVDDTTLSYSKIEKELIQFERAQA